LIKIKRSKQKNAEQVDQINSSGISKGAMLSVSDKYYSYSRGVAKCP